MNSEEALIKAFDQYADAIFRFCFYRVFDREKARDLTQDAFARTWEYLQKGKQIDNYRAFLYRTARNLIIDQSRKKRELSLEELQEQGTDFGFTDIEKIETALDAEALVARLGELPEEYQEALILRFVEDMNIAEIAAMLGERENTISVRLHRGINKLRELVKT